jgi:hypothetical protein
VLPLVGEGEDAGGAAGEQGKEGWWTHQSLPPDDTRKVELLCSVRVRRQSGMALTGGSLVTSA